MKRKLDLILEIESGVRQEGQPVGHIWRHFLQEIGIDKIGNGWRRRVPASAKIPSTRRRFPRSLVALRLCV